MLSGRTITQNNSNLWVGKIRAESEWLLGAGTGITFTRGGTSANCLMFLNLIVFLPSPKGIFSLFLDREEGRERSIKMREKHQLVAFYTCPDWGLNLQPRYVPWQGIEPVTSSAAPTSWATLARAMFLYLFKKDFISLFLERKGGRKRGREISMSGCLSCAPYWGPGPQPRHESWLGFEPTTLWFAGWCSIHWATPARAISLWWFHYTGVASKLIK